MLERAFQRANVGMEMYGGCRKRYCSFRKWRIVIVTVDKLYQSMNHHVTPSLLTWQPCVKDDTRRIKLL